MAMLSQQTLRSATPTSNTAGVIVRGRWQPGISESPELGDSVNYGGKLGCRAVAAFSSFQHPELLQLHLRGGGPPKFKFLSSCGKVCTQWHGRNLAFNRGSRLNRKTRNRDDSASSSEDERKGKEKETSYDQNDSNLKGDEQDAESQESGSEIGEVSRQEVPEVESGERSTEEEADLSEASVQKDGSKKGFWRQIWEPGQKDEDNTLGPEEELLLRELNNLSFDWKGLLDPTWENLLALGFTALLTLALLKIFSQLVIVVITILLSALKYTFLAALLLGLLIFLL